MKFVLVGVLVIASGGLTAAQSDQSKCQDFGRMVADIGQRMGTPPRPVNASAQTVADGLHMALIERIRKVTGIGVTADCIDVRSRSSYGNFRAQGNVTLTVGDLVITAEEAVVENGEIQLTGNARVRLPAK
jgi:hypothetical protein